MKCYFKKQMISDREASSSEQKPNNYKRLRDKFQVRVGQLWL